MTPSLFLFSLCLSFIFGVFIASFFNVSPLFLLLFLLLLFSLIFAFFRFFNILVFGVCFLFFVFGVFRYQDYFSKVQNQEIKNFVGEEISIVGVIDDEPKIREKSIIFTLKTEKGKILVKARRYPEFEYGEKVKVIGVLKEVGAKNSFNWKNYLLKDGILVEMDFPQIEKTGENSGNLIKKLSLSFRKKIEKTIKENLPPLHFSLLKSLLFGQEEDIPFEWKEKLNQTGTRHIVAVSGMNITIISSLILNFLLLLGLWRHHAFYLSIFLISFYVVMIGAPASAIRAAIMGILYLTAQYFGRLSGGERPVVFAATLMLFFNPLLLRYDIGFQLSFLAILGIVYFYQFFIEKLKPFPKLIKEGLAMTLSAQIFTFPILIYNFGQISLISPLTNILILPILPTITVLGFVFGFSGLVSQFLCFLLSFPCWIFLEYLLRIIDFSSQLPFSYLILKTNFLFLLISYSLLIPLALYLNKKFSQPIFLRY
jgi:competence protein ComEC